MLTIKVDSSFMLLEFTATFHFKSETICVCNLTMGNSVTGHVQFTRLMRSLFQLVKSSLLALF